VHLLTRILLPRRLQHPSWSSVPSRCVSECVDVLCRWRAPKLACIVSEVEEEEGGVRGGLDAFVACRATESELVLVGLRLHARDCKVGLGLPMGL
jgi:hypothetical protein